MPPKGKKSTGGAKSKPDEEHEQPLQAVVLADSFEQRFEPFTLERPRCLLPLANTPLIEYTLEFLASSGVEEVYVYSGNHADQVEEYLNQSRWTKDTSPFALEIIRSTSSSVGDCMRDIDQKGLIKNDFICVYGDVVANIPLESALAAHKARREKNKNAIMTMILREAGDYHRTKSNYVRRCFVIDSETERCVHYEQVRPMHSPRLNIPEEVLKDRVEIEVREDLIDCGIDICAPDVLAQWSDSFDWKMPRHDFLHGVLQDYETFQRTIHAHVVTDGYAARVNNLRAYDTISKDVLGRWTYPLVPDTNILFDQSYQLSKGNVYKEDGVVLARSSKVGKGSMLGKASSLGEGSVVRHSVIGRRCVIGRRVKIEGAYVLDDARIGDDSVIEGAVVANEVSVGKKCHIKPGALLSYGVSISDGVTVEENARISKLKRKRGYDSDDFVQAVTDPNVVGEGGTGILIELDENEEEVLETLMTGVQHLNFVGIGDHSDFDDEDEDGGDGTFELDHAHDRSSRADSFGSIGSIGSDGSGETRRNAADFHHEAANSIFDSLRKGDDPDNIQLELKALRMSSNAGDSQVRRAVAVAFSKRIADLVEGGKSPKDAVTDAIKPNQRLIKSCVKEVGEQAEFLLFLQTDLVHRPQGSKVLLFASNLLATNDLVEAEGFEQWWNDPKSSANADLESVRAETKQLVDVLVGDDDEEDEEDDEDDEDDDDDDRKRNGAGRATSRLVVVVGKANTLSQKGRTHSSQRDSSFLRLVSAIFLAVHPPPLAQPGHHRSSHHQHHPPSDNPPARFVIDGAEPRPSPTTPSVTRKRALDAANTTATQQDDALSQQPKRKASKTHHGNDEPTNEPAQLPATPQTLSDKPMDSDDDFNSVASSMELGEEMSSSVDFGAADSDVEFDEYQEDETAFEATAKDLAPRRKAFEVEHKVYSPRDIQAQQDAQVAEVANLLEQPPEATAILLRYARWNKERLIEQYMDQQEAVLDKAGLGQDISRHPPQIKVIPGFTCDICCEDSPGLESFAMSCGHRFCVGCYRHYLTQKIKEEGEAARIKCPGEGCSKIIDAKSLDILVPSDLTDRYHELLMRTYVDDKENLKWCPAPNCVYAVECGVRKRDLNRIVPTVHCDCKHAFCFGCTLPDHQPCPCVLVKKWLKKCEDDSETANWISANTKECPKCHSTIEKNGGCNHMTCRKCKHEFCWMCMGVWSEHGTSWYNCNRFEEKSGTDARDAQAKSRQSLERYLHYYNRYANHEQSARLDKDIFHKTEKKMTLLQSSSGMSWIEVQFLEAASQALQQCRQTLKWTYAFAYYLARNNQTEIFEDNQKDLEMAVENLSEMFEKPTDQLAGLKVEMMDKTTYCMRRRVILLDDTAKNLREETWQFNIDLTR